VGVGGVGVRGRTVCFFCLFLFLYGRRAVIDVFCVMDISIPVSLPMNLEHDGGDGE